MFVAVWNRRQPCIVSAAVDRDTSLDVHVFALGTVQTLPAMPGPTVTGFVFEMTPEGRKPLRNAEVWLDLSAESYIANTETDEHGRFLLCGVNTRVRLDVSVSGYEPYMYAESVPGTGNRHFEFEFKR